MIGVGWGLVSVVEPQGGQCAHVVFRRGGVTVGKRIPEVRHPGVAELIHCGCLCGNKSSRDRSR